MDASASTFSDVDKNNVYGFIFQIENTDVPKDVMQTSKIIKFTKIPEFDFENKAQSVQSRLRRFMTLEDPQRNTSRSLKPELIIQSKDNMATNISTRKIVTISEDDENDLHPRFSKNTHKASPAKTCNKAIRTDLKEPKHTTQRSTARISTPSKYYKETKPNVTVNITDGKDKPKSNYRSKKSNITQVTIENTSVRNPKEKVPVRSTKSYNSSKTTVSRNNMSPCESEKELTLIKSKLYDNLKVITPKNTLGKPKTNNSAPQILKDPNRQKQSTVIHVPLEKYRKSVFAAPHTGTCTQPFPTQKHVSAAAPTTAMPPSLTHKDIDTSTDPLPKKVDSFTEMDNFDPELILKCVHSTDMQTEVIKETFDSLVIPNVSLLKDKSESKQESQSLHSQSLPNLQVPLCKVTSNNEEIEYHKRTSYVISRATVTCTTKQKINLHLVGSNGDAYSNKPPSPLSYPINVVSVFKKEMQKSNSSTNIVVNDKEEGNKTTSKEYKNRINDIKSLDCSYVANSDKLMKPSDIISSIRVNNGLLRSEYICEQFQSELNFIDSFFESLQYLESCSLSERSYKDNTIGKLVAHPELLESEFDEKIDSIEYDSFLSKWDNGAGSNIDDTETMASKNLFMLNILIRDEQRRAKNLLFVLKRREEALKEFTKSQILYLENKKKQENTDICALKKKQRGALLKLQHECGEMQRMRRALVALAHRRRGSLLDTKRELELKLKSNLQLDKMMLTKKKPKRSASSGERGSPLKCFDLSSSGCEDSSASPQTSPEATPVHASSADKSMHTAITNTQGCTTSPADEHFIIVDGGYLNILFHNLSLPQIFSGGKQYEVNEEALGNIVASTNSQHCIDGAEAIHTLMDNINNRNLDRSSSPSTARSLVEEFDQYYRGLNDCDKSPADETEYRSSTVESSDAVVQVELARSSHSVSTMTSDSNETLVNRVANVSSGSCVCELPEEQMNEEPGVTEAAARAVLCPAGPLPVPAGAAALLDTPLADALSWCSIKSPSTNSSVSESSSSFSSQSLCEVVSSVTSLTAPAQSEAEELRRQQLAIEREIKELEQQQCRLIVVREIPDKPPPPYTPPTETRPPHQPRPFKADDATEDRIRVYMGESKAPLQPNDSFDAFVHDFCLERVERQKEVRSPQPWASCNLLPVRVELESAQVAAAASADLAELLAGAKPTHVSGVSSKRSDHIDDILFAEWRRIEPEWTSLHTDEAIVKNNIFESIFQRILTDTVDEYKRTVLCTCEPRN